VSAGTVILRGERCLLRAFRPDEVDLILAARGEPDAWVGARDPATRSRDELSRRVETSGRIHDGFLELAIEAGGELVGDVQARRPRRALPPGVWELGIELYSGANRGHGFGTEAFGLITSYLFDEQHAGRVQATTDVENAAMRAVMRKLGFREEGVLRAFMPTSDEDEPRHDYVIAAITATDWRSR
jgi:RimJ/RimL family protein N-acetyltransferase